MTDAYTYVPTAVSPTKAAEILGVHVNTIRNLYRSGKLPAFKVGAAIRIKTSNLTAMMELNAERPEEGDGPLDLMAKELLAGGSTSQKPASRRQLKLAASLNRRPNIY